METEVKAMRVEGRTLDQLYRLHIDQAFRLAYLLTGDRTVAEDLAQDAFMRIAGRLLHLRRPGDFGAYLRKTVVSIAMSPSDGAGWRSGTCVGNPGCDPTRTSNPTWEPGTRCGWPS